MSEKGDLALEALTDFLNGVEAGIESARRHIKSKKSVWNPDAIKWEKAEGSKGEYERSEDVNNPEFKAMLKDLAAHLGRMNHEGYFYWTFQNGTTVGRKKR